MNKTLFIMGCGLVGVGIGYGFNLDIMATTFLALFVGSSIVLQDPMGIKQSC